VKLSEYIDTQHSRNPFWIWAHIDDGGPRWFLAALSRMDDGEPGVRFVLDDFEDWAENYADREVVELVPPAAPQRKGSDT